MKKSILSLGEALDRENQQKISGGMLTIDKCPYFNCVCNGTPGIPVDNSFCDGLPQGQIGQAPNGHCAVILIGSTCYACV